ncbi:lysylphosphatidylglycerol synthase domain-containing protein, partial [Actinomycetospora sp. TBRC 11914]|uniref:lysylphosphatidylglycerol synthase domain-containing protein n=1 Tax=Actinomycetospora sp. TBRC 11914 TaxID=2729387 RepID=UPI00145E680D
HGRRSGDVGRGVQGVVLERVAGQAVVVVVGAVVLLAAPGPLRGLLAQAVPDATALASAAGVALAVLLGVAAVPGVRRALARLGGGIRRGLFGTRTGPAVLALSLVTMAGHLALLEVAALAVGVPAGFGVLAPLLMLSLLSMGLPVNVGGWGPREATTAAAFGLAGLGADTGLAVAVAFGVLALVSTLPGLGVLALRRTVQRRAAAPTNSPRYTFRARPASVA